MKRALALLALVCVALQFPGRLWLSALAVALWLGALALFEREALRRLWMPRFWLVTVLFALGSGLLLGRRDAGLLGLPLSAAGLEAGALMVVRGLLIFALAMWASRNVDERLIRRAARRVGLDPLGAAIPAALRLLPELQERYREAARRTAGQRRRPYRLAVELLCDTARLAERMAGPALFLIVGDRGAGKSTTAERAARRLVEAGVVVGGVLQPALRDGDERTGYGLRDLTSGEERPFARRRPRPATSPTELGFEFDVQGWDWARRCILEARRSAGVLVVDELGRLEARGEGHLPALLEPLERERAEVWMLALRADEAEGILARLGREPELALDAPADDDALDRFVAALLLQCQGAGRRKEED